MKFATFLRSMILALFHRDRNDREMDEELRFHIQNRVDDLTHSGLSRAEAERRAHLEFGGYEKFKEECREATGVHFVDTLLQDIRYGLRMLRKSPAFTAIAVLTLALGIGANTAIFSLIDAVMLRMLPVHKPEELLQLTVSKAGDQPNLMFTNRMWEEIRNRQDVFSGAFAWSPWPMDLTQGEESQNVNGLYVSGDFFNTLGVRPATGRLLTTSDDIRGCSGVATLSYAFWQRYYGGDPGVVGSVINLDRHPFQVVGVTAPGFFGVNVGTQFDVAIPICTQDSIFGVPSMLDGGGWWLSIMGRPKQGVSPENVSARLRILSPEILSAAAPRGESAEDMKRTRIDVHSAGTGVSDFLRSTYDRPLKVLMGVVGLLLLIACANIATLMLSRAAARNNEIAVRLALGASRPRLIRQLLTECILLSCAGTLLGILFARWGCMLLVHFISTHREAVFLDLSFNGRMLVYTASIAVVTGLLFGVLPALRSTRFPLSASMSRGPLNVGRSYFRSGRWIVASQIALSLVLLIVAGLFLQSFNALLRIDTGFNRNNLLIVSIDEKFDHLSNDQWMSLNQQILSRLALIPGIDSVSESVFTPFVGTLGMTDVRAVPGEKSSKDLESAYMGYVSPAYFKTMQTPIQAGSAFNDLDLAKAPVAMISETLACKLFPHSSPVGQYLIDPANPAQPIRIVGMVKNVKFLSLRDNQASLVYFPIEQWKYQTGRQIEIRTNGNPNAFTRTVEDAIRSINKGISLTFETSEEQVSASVRQDEILATLSGFFGGLALLLAMTGLYGVLAYMVTQRRKEIGIRMALGAGRESILGLILRDVSILLVVGISVGVVVSLWATQFLQKMLFDLKARDPKTILVSVAVLAAVALLAGYLPARRASHLDPMTTLRDE